MKSFCTLLAIILGVASILYYRVDVGMSWEAMRFSLYVWRDSTLIPLLLLAMSQVAVFFLFHGFKKYFKNKNGTTTCTD